MSSDLDRLAGEFDSMGRGARAAVERAVRKTAVDISSTAKATAPVDTGNLKNSIGHTVTSGADEVSAEIGPTASYGVFVEFGTSRMAPQPYLGPAFDRHVPAFVQAISQVAGGRFG